MLPKIFAITFAVASLGLGGCHQPEEETPQATATTAQGHCDASKLSQVNIGHVEFEYSYNLAWSDTPRTVLMHVWYPTTETLYTEDDDRSRPATYIDTFEDYQSIEDAQFAFPAGDCKLPVYAYSHGDRAFAGNSTTTTRDLIKSGWVVVAPDHTSNTLKDSGSDGAIGLNYLRQLDLVAAMDAIETEGHTELFGAIGDTRKVLIGGHSYGGRTVWTFSGAPLVLSDEDAESDRNGAGNATIADAIRSFEGDPRVAGIVALDGNAGNDVLTDENLKQKTVPMMLLAASNRAGSGPKPQFDRLPSEAVMVQFTVGEDEDCHELFTSLDAYGAQCGAFTDAEAASLIRQYLGAFARRTVLGTATAADDALLSGDTELHPDLVVEEK